MKLWQILIMNSGKIVFVSVVRHRDKLLQEKLSEVFGELHKKGTFKFDQEPFRRELTGSMICWVKYTKYLTPKIVVQAEKTVDMKYLERQYPIRPQSERLSQDRQIGNCSNILKGIHA